MRWPGFGKHPTNVINVPAGTHIPEQCRRQISAPGHGVIHDRAASSRLPRDGNPLFVPSEAVHKALHPRQGKGLVQEAGIYNTAGLHFGRG